MPFKDQSRSLQYELAGNMLPVNDTIIPRKVANLYGPFQELETAPE